MAGSLEIRKRAHSPTHHEWHRGNQHRIYPLWETAYVLSQSIIFIGMGIVGIGAFTIFALLDLSSSKFNPHMTIGLGCLGAGAVMLLFGGTIFKIAKRRLRRYRFRKRR